MKAKQNLVKKRKFIDYIYTQFYNFFLKSNTSIIQQGKQKKKSKERYR